MIFVYFFITFFSFWILFKETLDKVRNYLLKFSLIFFFSTYISTFILFVTATTLSLFTTNLLLKAICIYVTALAVFVFYRRNILKELLKELYKSLSRISFLKVAVVVTIFVGSYSFFSNHLAVKNEEIYTSFVFWDFKWLIRLVENFAKGDNFPPVNESVSGVYQVYHFFWAIIPSTYQILGLNIAQSFNLFSTLSLGFIILVALGFMELYGYSKLAYVVVPIFILTHGSLKFADHLSLFLPSPSLTLQSLFTSRADLVDFNVDGRFGYNGNMFNVFYFIQERQLIFALFALLIFIYILLHASYFKAKILILFGVLFGLFMQWHFFIWIEFLLVGITYLSLAFVFSKKIIDRKLVIFILTLTITSIMYAVLLKLYINSQPIFNTEFLNQFPKINFDFPTMQNYKFSFVNVLIHYIYAYGIRIYFYLLAFYVSYKINKKAFLLLLAFIPIFVLMNTIQFSSFTIYDNHKFLKSFNLVMDIFSLIFFLVFAAKSHISRIVSLTVIFFAVFSGLIGLISFFFQKSNVLFFSPKNEHYKKIEKSNPRSVFLTDNEKTVFMAGRKVFYTTHVGIYGGLKIDDKKQIHEQISSLSDRQSICIYIQSERLNNEIDYVYLKDKKIFLNVKKDCYNDILKISL